MKLLILGATGSGKSSSLVFIPQLEIEGLDPTTTFIIASKDKELPVRGASTLYKEGLSVNQQGQLNPIPKGVNLATNVKLPLCINLLNHALNTPHIETVVLEDFQYFMADEVMYKNMEWEGYKVMARSIYAIIDKGVPKDKNLIILSHYEESSENKGMKTSGNMLDKQAGDLVGLFTTVLYTTTQIDPSGKMGRCFVTNNDGRFPAKSPVGMFDQLYIKNDLGKTVKTMKNFYAGV